MNNSYISWKTGFFKDAARKNAPVDVILELTSRCNLNCKMCYVHNSVNQDVISKELSTEQWKRIIDEAVDCGMLFTTLTGGECLLRRDFKELYLYLYNKGMHITVFSNAVLMNNEYVEFFSKYPPREIQVSIYGSNNSYYENVTGSPVFDIVHQNLLLLKGLHNSELRISVTPSRYLTDDYYNILNYCKLNGLSVSNNFLFLFDNRDNKEKCDYKLSVDDFVEFEKYRHELKKPLTPLNDLPKPHGKNTEQYTGTHCNAGTCRAFISWDGYMSPCVNLLICKETVISASFQKAWEKTVMAAKEFIQPIECMGCAFARVCFHCPAIRLSPDNAGHCNPFACDLTVAKCEAGIFAKL